ncbi:prolactin-releasing peptide receptor-like [Babylonia areolata]|uniref:prolactin-releasing peptide receptor-like n=1 Tax=Babylonia areolata TaxID=304850 RepID=UPI003FD5D379
MEASEETYVHHVLQWLETVNKSGRVDFTQPFVRPSLHYVYPLFVFLYATVGTVGIAGNAAMLFVIARRRLYHDQTFFLMGNLALSNLIKCVFSLPITLANLLIQNWLFGSFICFFLPMLQTFPVYASFLTFLMIAIDRYRLILHPFKSRLPAGLCIIAVWVAAVCTVLPYAIYIKYIDLGATLGTDFGGVGICYVAMEDRIEEYIRALFVTLYVMPLAVIAFLYVRISAEIKSREATTISIHFATTATATAAAAAASSGGGVVAGCPPDGSPSRGGDSAVRIRSYAATERSTQDSDDDLDLAKEKRTQNYLITMTTVFAMCWCPINILILVAYFVHENDNNEESYDITYITFTWFAFLSTCTTPVLFASWRMSSATKDRLRGYFRFSNRRHNHAAAPRRHYHQKHYMERGCCNMFEDHMIMDSRSITQDGDHV